MTILTLVRHGETAWNYEGRIQGSTDIPLNDTGRVQARGIAETLAAEYAGRDVIVVSSDLGRAAETADIIAAALGTTVSRRLPGLQERSYGDAEGMDAPTFYETYGPWHAADVPGAETWPVVRERALAAIAEAVASAPVGVDVIAVAHGALIREVIMFATDGEFPREGERLPNCSATTFRLEGDRWEMLAYAGVAS
ncbi:MULTISPECIES: histidine phosphatase family protein [Microbacterium]|uniref:Phosphoglycerate mutase n=1 Tax=Microbacterium testaceum TaxID=2033 RepID=A0A4Y3QKI1_MICTE|nr:MULTISPECIES: histidine phosphatase family protein [Microbacterium]MDZ5143878.1 histidine phosphatase family protein [Microbacterium testaceum]PNW08763.1 histidine phosphatase family protein [Microbacterium testaceum]REC96767.1 putative phosphoglycerate mutase [Microbacterium sp. AG157]GEB45784.1 phosphoglycerate mutase [Microbacterium testaceum]